MARIRGGEQIVRRGEIILAALPGDYGKPQPKLVVQSEALENVASVALCPIASDGLAASSAFRVNVAPSTANGLVRPSQVMIDRVCVAPREKLGQRIGQLTDEQMAEVSVALSVLLGLA